MKLSNANCSRPSPISRKTQEQDEEEGGGPPRHNFNVHSSTRSSHRTTSSASTNTQQQQGEEDFNSETWMSLLGLVDLPLELFITIDQTTLWQRHIAWANPKGKDIREYLTKRFASNMIFLSLLLGSTMGILMNSANFSTEMRVALRLQNYGTNKYWMGVTLIIGAVVTVLGLVATYTAWGLISAISDSNAHAILRSSMGQYVQSLPSKFVVGSLYLYLISLILFVVEIVAGPGRFLLIALVTGLFFQVVLSLSAFGRLLIHTGALGKKRILDPELERYLLPSGLHASLLIKAMERKHRRTSVTAQYQSQSPRHPPGSSTLPNAASGRQQRLSDVTHRSNSPRKQQQSSREQQSGRHSNRSSILSYNSSLRSNPGSKDRHAPVQIVREQNNSLSKQREESRLPPPPPPPPRRENYGSMALSSTSMVSGEAIQEHEQQNEKDIARAAHVFSGTSSSAMAYRQHNPQTSLLPPKPAPRGQTSTSPYPLPQRLSSAGVSGGHRERSKSVESTLSVASSLEDDGEEESVDDLTREIAFPRPSVLNRTGGAPQLLKHVVQQTLSSHRKSGGGGEEEQLQEDDDKDEEEDGCRSEHKIDEAVTDQEYGDKNENAVAESTRRESFPDQNLVARRASSYPPSFSSSLSSSKVGEALEVEDNDISKDNNFYKEQLNSSSSLANIAKRRSVAYYRRNSHTPINQTKKQIQQEWQAEQDARTMYDVDQPMLKDFLDEFLFDSKDEDDDKDYNYNSNQNLGQLRSNSDNNGASQDRRGYGFGEDYDEDASYYHHRPEAPSPKLPRASILNRLKFGSMVQFIQSRQHIPEEDDDEELESRAAGRLPPPPPPPPPADWVASAEMGEGTGSSSEIDPLLLRSIPELEREEEEGPMSSLSKRSGRLGGGH